jgi:hypothetical protein
MNTVLKRPIIYFLPLTLALGIAACGVEDGSPKATKATANVEALVDLCPDNRLQSFSVVTDGSYGAPSSWVGVCKDGSVVEVDD